MKTRSWVEFSFAVGLLLTINAAFGRTPPGNVAFEVATVKPSPPLDFAKLAQEVRAGKMPRLGAHISNSQAEYIYMTLKELIATAYDVKEYQISGPSWLGSERFDIVAKIPDGASKDDAPKMLQSLLQERFKLATHRDNQDRPVLGLVVGKDGPKLKESPANTPQIDPNAPLQPGERQVDGPNGPIRMTRNGDGSTTMNMGAKGIVTTRVDVEAKIIHIESSSVTMAGFADMLTRILQRGSGDARQVVDMTGLAGNYQVAVDISIADALAAARSEGVNLPMPPPSSGEAGMPGSLASDPAGGYTVFGSVKKLGLKLEPRNASVEQLVIDHMEKTPTEN